MKKITKIELTATTKKTKKRRVAAYCRVSTGMDDQLVSLETQKAHYEDYISANPDWEYAGLYYDEGITGILKPLGVDGPKDVLSFGLLYCTLLKKMG